MTTLDLPLVAPAVPTVRKFWRPATIIVAAASTIILVAVAQHVIDSGYLRRDAQALQEGDAWRTGGWLSQVVLRVVSLLPQVWMQQMALSLTGALVCGLAFGVLYDRLRSNGWFALGAIALLIALALHAGSLYTLSASSRAIPLYLAFAVLIPAIRSLEDVGDVQSAIGLGLLLPMLLLASPITTPLIIPIAIGAALAEPDGRRDPRAFAAMLLVAILPTLIVAVGIFGFLVQAHIDVADALFAYVAAYSDIHLGDVLGSVATLAVYAPVLLVPLVYCVWPNLPEKRHMFSALAIIAMPLYLAVARVTLNTAMTPIVPPMALLAAFMSWLAFVRLPVALRIFALAMLVLAVAASWTQTGLWYDAEWRGALLYGLPESLGNLGLRPGV
ncbi:MAG: hypothetical protein ABIQ30_05185 [Devosia sp.]